MTKQLILIAALILSSTPACVSKQAPPKSETYDGISTTSGLTENVDINYSAINCQGSLIPYPSDIPLVEYPDTLIPKYISHVSRHGSRFPAGSTHTEKLKEILEQASKEGTITPLGKELLALTKQIIKKTGNRWGALDQLGKSEQASIATRMFTEFKSLFANGARINAISSYSPRSIESMQSFITELKKKNNNLIIESSEGKKYSNLLRPFDTDNAYKLFRKLETWKPTYENYFNEVCPLSAIQRVVGDNYPFKSLDESREAAIMEYYVVAGLEAMELPNQLSKYFTDEEMNALWSCFNLRQYLQYTSTTISSVPADMATPLLAEIIDQSVNAVNGRNQAVADLRFGHAETMMPLLSLLKLPGCYFHTDDFFEVSKIWKDFSIIPMAANLQFIFFQNLFNGKWYVRTELNESLIKVIPGDDRLYLPWDELREYLTNCLTSTIQMR